MHNHVCINVPFLPTTLNNYRLPQRVMACIKTCCTAPFCEPYSIILIIFNYIDSLSGSSTSLICMSNVHNGTMQRWRMHSCGGVIYINTLRLRQNYHHFADSIFECISMNENALILIKILLKFVPRVQIENMPALVQIMAWCWPCKKSLSELMVVNLLTHICVTQPQWVNPSDVKSGIVSEN